MITKQELFDKLTELSNKVYYSEKYCQFTIDLIDEVIPEFLNSSLNDWETTVGALSYKLSTLLEVMNKTSVDYKILMYELYKIIKK